MQSNCKYCYFFFFFLLHHRLLRGELHYSSAWTRGLSWDEDIAHSVEEHTLPPPQSCRPSHSQSSVCAEWVHVFWLTWNDSFSQRSMRLCSASHIKTSQHCVFGHYFIMYRCCQSTKAHSTKKRTTKSIAPLIMTRQQNELLVIFDFSWERAAHIRGDFHSVFWRNRKLWTLKPISGLIFLKRLLKVSIHHFNNTLFIFLLKKKFWC